MSCRKAKHKGDKKGEQAQLKPSFPIMLDTAYVQFQSRQEHDVVDAYLTEQLKGTVAFQNVKAVFPHQHTGKDKSYHMGNM